MEGARKIAISPLGNNSVDQVPPPDGFAAGGDVTPQPVPLVYDSITGNFMAKLSATNQEDREVDLDRARKSNEDTSYLRMVGFTGG